MFSHSDCVRRGDEVTAVVSATLLAVVTVAARAEPSFASGITMATGALFIDASLPAALVLLLAAVRFARPRPGEGG